jgi:hypothetical protein
MLEGLKSWLRSRSKPLNQLLAVEFDDSQVQVSVLEELEAGWNQSFQWTDITRVCFEDGGMLSSDVIYVCLQDRVKPVVVPTEARGGHDFFGALAIEITFQNTSGVERSVIPVGTTLLAAIIEDLS